MPFTFFEMPYLYQGTQKFAESKSPDFLDALCYIEALKYLQSEIGLHFFECPFCIEALRK